MNRNLIVAVWGNDGAGKTTFSAALAEDLSKYFRSILLVNADAMQPAFNLWGVVPDEEQAEKEGRKVESIGQIMKCANLTEEYIRHRVQYLPKNLNIGLIAYLPRDDFEAYRIILGNDAQTFLHEVKKLFQVTLVDCSMPQSEEITDKALQDADVHIVLLEPNCLGVAFLRAQTSFIRNNMSDQSQYVFLASKVEPRSAVPEFEAMLGVKFDKACLPETQQARDKLYAHELFSPYEGEYGAAVERIALLIKEEAQK